MEWQQQQYAASADRLMATIKRVNLWPGLSGPVRNAWLIAWEKAKCRPGTITLTPAEIAGPLDRDSSRGLDYIRKLIKAELFEIVIPPNLRSRLPGANVWRVYVFDPLVPRQDQLSFAEQDKQLYLEFGDEADHLVAGTTGTEGSVPGDDGPRLLLFQLPRQDAAPSGGDTVAGPPISPTPSSLPDFGAQVAAPVRPPTPRAELGSTSREVAPKLGPTSPSRGLKTQEVDLSTETPDSSGNQRSTSEESRIGIVRATEGRPEVEPTSGSSTTIDRTLAAALQLRLEQKRQQLQTIEQRDAPRPIEIRLPAGPDPRRGELIRTKAEEIYALVGDRGMGEDFVYQVATDVVEGIFKPRKLEKCFRSLDRKRPSLTKSPGAFFYGCIVQSYRDEGLTFRIGTAPPRPR